MKKLDVGRAVKGSSITEATGLDTGRIITMAPPSLTDEESTNNIPVIDPTETSLGISAYRSAEVPGFSAVLKGRYSDFIVHEVSLDHDKAELTSLSCEIEGAPEDSAAVDKKRKREESKADNGGAGDDDSSPPTKKDTSAATAPSSAPEEKPDLDWETLKTELVDLLQDQEDGTGNSNQCAAEVISFLQKEPDAEQKFVSIPTSPDKRKRRALHEWVRARVSTRALADTAEEKGMRVIRVWNRDFAKDMPNFQNFDRRAKVKPPKKFLRFVVYKENLDTNSAMQQITRRCGGRGKHAVRLGFAGMKDKRGVTSQFVTMPARSSIESLLKSINPAEKEDTPKAGGGHTDAAGVAVLRIGNFMYVDQDLRLGRLQGNRFDIVLRNVLMPDKSASREATKEVMTRAAKALREAGFINYFGAQRFGKYLDTHLVGIAILQKDYAKAVKLILQPKPDERENTSKARLAWQERFAKLKEGASQEEKAAAEKECAKRIIGEFGRFMHNEVAILRSLSERPMDYRRAIGFIAKTMRMMFVHAIQSFLWNHAASFRLKELGTDIVEGDLVPDGPINILDPGIPKVRRVTAEDVEKKRYTLEDVYLPLMGNKTVDPDNATAKVYTKLLSEHGLKRESFDVKDRDFNCEGDYRRLVVRPKDVDFDVLEYTDPRQPLVQTDLMKLQDIQIETTGEESKDALLAMRVGFTLPPSAYATVALRELMKRPTSSDYQKDLSLE